MTSDCQHTVESPSKKARLEEQTPVPAAPADFCDDDDVYTNSPENSQLLSSGKPAEPADPVRALEPSTPPTATLPGLGMLRPLHQPTNHAADLEATAHGSTPPIKAVANASLDGELSQLASKEHPVDRSTTYDNAVDDAPNNNTSVADCKEDVPSIAIRKWNPESTEYSNAETIATAADTADSAVPGRHSQMDANANTVAEPVALSEGSKEFLEAAAAQKGIDDAEWELDSSDSASTTETSSSSDEDSDADDYKLLGPEEQARILMMEEAGSDDEGRKTGKITSESQPRTANEQIEMKVEKPDIKVTANMQIVELGSAINVVDNLLLIQGITSGETQVLESGSVLCLENRTVIGVVNETFGRVDAPLYSVAFNNATELKDIGIERGVLIFYVKDHSTYVFTKPLRMVKGSDASNLYDEEADEIEFSDDEAEALYKQQKKAAKQSKRGLKTTANPSTLGNLSSNTRPPPHEMAYPTQPLDYDGLYTPLRRPSVSDPKHQPQRPRERSAGPGEHVRGRGGRGMNGRGRGNRGRSAGWGGNRDIQDHTGQGPGGYSQHHEGRFDNSTSRFAVAQYGNANNLSNTASTVPTRPLPSGAFLNPAFFPNFVQLSQQSPPVRQHQPPHFAPIRNTQQAEGGQFIYPPQHSSGSGQQQGPSDIQQNLISQLQYNAGQQ